MAPLALEHDDTTLPHDLADSETAAYLKKTFMDPYSFDGTAMVRSLGTRQRNYLLYRLKLDCGRLRRRRCDLGPSACHVAVSACALFGNYGDAQEFFDSLKALGRAPLLPTYDALLMAYARRGKMDEVIRVRAEMREQGHKPTHQTYNAVLLALGNSSSQRRENAEAAARMLFESMVASGMHPTAATLHAMLACCRSHAAAASTIRCFHGRYGVKPDAFTMARVIRACRWKGETEAAEQELERARRAKLATANVWNALAEVYAAAGHRAAVRVQEVLRRMTATGVAPNESTYVQLLGACATEITATPSRAGALTELAESAFQSAAIEGLLVTRRVYDALCAVYAAARAPDRVDALERRMREDGYDPSQGFLENQLLAQYEADDGLEPESDQEPEAAPAPAPPSPPAPAPALRHSPGSFGSALSRFLGNDPTPCTDGEGDGAATGAAADGAPRRQAAAPPKPQTLGAEMDEALAHVGHAQRKNNPPQERHSGPAPEPKKHWKVLSRHEARSEVLRLALEACTP